MANRFSRRRRRQTETANIQITAMADIFIVILVFLLKSFSASWDTLRNVSLKDGIKLPRVKSGIWEKEGLKVRIAENMVEVNGIVVSKLSNWTFAGNDLNHDLQGDNGTSKSLNDALRGERERDRDHFQGVWVVADRRAPYRTIQTVLASAALQGFTDFRLAVVRDEREE